MSRVAKKPIALPKGVEVKIEDELITVKGPKGTMTQAKPASMQIKNENNELVNVADSSTDGEASTTSMNVENTVNTHTATTYQPYTW